MLSLTSGIGVLMSVTVLISTTESIYAAFVFAALLRSFVYSVDANVVNLVLVSHTIKQQHHCGTSWFSLSSNNVLHPKLVRFLGRC